jgi:tetratricopeptide (TPR) repeat protein
VKTVALKYLNWAAKPLPVTLGLALATFWLFAPALSYDYLNYDDGMYVYGNDAVRQGLGVSGVKYAFHSIRGGIWMPLTWLSHMLDVTLFGMGPAGHHFTNLLLHSVNAALLLWVLFRASRQLWPAVFVAALFALHPLRNESVVWIAERKDVLCAWFWLLGMLAYVRYVEKPGLARFGLVCGALVGALLAKPMAMTFPFVLLLMDYWPLRRLNRGWEALKTTLPRLVKEKAALFGLVVVIALVAFWSQREVGAMKENTFGVSERMMGAAHNYVFYLHKSLLPTRLTILYPDPKLEPVLAGLCAAGLLVITGLAVRWAFKLPWLLVGWLWFLGTAVPVIGFVRVGHIAMADRYSYLPSIGLAIALVGSVAQVGQDRPMWRRVCVASGVLVLALLAMATRADLPRWRNSLALFEAANRVAPHAVAYNNIAVHYLDSGEFARAIAPASRAIQLNPRYENAYVNRAIARERTGDLEGAKLDYARVDGREPRSAEGYNNRAATWLKEGRYPEAIRDYTFALEFAPDSAVTFNNRGNAYLLAGDLESATRDCSQALELDPNCANAWINLGNCYNAKQNYPAALTNYSRAVTLTPADPLPYNNRAAVFFRLGQYDAAGSDLRQCRELGGTPHPALVEALTRATGTNQ